MQQVKHEVSDAPHWSYRWSVLTAPTMTSGLGAAVEGGEGLVAAGVAGTGGGGCEEGAVSCFMVLGDGGLGRET